MNDVRPLSVVFNVHPGIYFYSVDLESCLSTNVAFVVFLIYSFFMGWSPFYAGSALLLCVGEAGHFFKMQEKSQKLHSGMKWYNASF